MMGFYSCLDVDRRFFKTISLLKIINEDKITKPALKFSKEQSSEDETDEESGTTPLLPQ